MKAEEQEDNNPFDDMFFWLTLATTDFSWIFEKSNDNVTELVDAPVSGIKIENQQS